MEILHPASFAISPLPTKFPAGADTSQPDSPTSIRLPIPKPLPYLA